MKTRRILLIACATFLITSPLTAQDATALKVKEILTSRCYYCHGEDGAAEGGLNFILDHERLLATKQIVPKEPLKSVLYRKIVLDDMPKDDDPLSDEEKQLIKKWIADGAASFNPQAKAREFIGPEQVYKLLAADILKQEEEVRRHMRYFNITHLYNAGIGEDELETYRRGLSKLLNSLSWAEDIKVPVAVDAARTIFRIDLLDYDWDEETWEFLAENNPYRIIYKFSEAKVVEREARTRVPNIQVNWFVATASVPPLYHQLLALPDNAKDLEDDLIVNVNRNIEKNRVVRAGFNGSGVSGNNRLIERHRADNDGYYWKSYDFEEVEGIFSKRNLFDRPLGPGGNKGFVHDGSELIFSLPNGMQAYMLIDKNENRIDKGPITIVQDNKRPDRQVVNGLSCMSCHARGIITKRDQIRPTVLKNKMAYEDSLGEKGVEKILEIYPEQKELDKLYEQDRKRFAEAVEKSGGRVTDTEPIVMLAQQFEQEVDLALAAAEAGLPAKEFSRRLNATADLARVLGRLLVEGGTVTRSTYRTAFPTMVPSLRLDLPGNLADAQTVTRPARIQVFDGGPEFVLIPAGKFIMGGLIDGKEGDHPPHKVEITKPFYLAVSELSVSELRALLKDGKISAVATNSKARTFRFGNNLMFVDKNSLGVEPSGSVSVSFSGSRSSPSISQLLRVINQSAHVRLKGFRFRLPTEAEWEYAARAGTEDLPWLGANGSKIALFEVATGKLKSRKPNPFGLHDTLGMRQELVSDFFHFDYYRVSPEKDPRGPDSHTFVDPITKKPISRRITRGGFLAALGPKKIQLVTQRFTCESSDSGAVRLVLEFIDDDEKKKDEEKKE